MKRFILAIVCVVGAAAVFLAQVPRGELAGLIQTGNRLAALERIRAGADVNEAQPDGTRPVHWAVYRVDYELLTELIAKNARVDVRNELGSTPLAEAVKVGDTKMVRMLLDAGSGPEGANPDGQTALMLAVRRGDVALVRMLADAGANVNAAENVQDQTPLMWAVSASQNAEEIVKILIAKGADVNATARYTDWPSQITSEPRAQYHPYGGLTALLYAARGGCYGCIAALVDGGADVNLPTPEGVTPLMIALDNDHTNVAKLLLGRGANPHVWDVYGRTALYIAVDAKNGGSGGRDGRRAFGGRGGEAGPTGALDLPRRPAVPPMEIVTALLDAGVDPNPQLSMRRPSSQGGRFSDPLLNTGATPLLRAVMGNDMETIKALLNKGADPNAFGMGTTPFLLAAGVDPYSRRGGREATGTGTSELLDLMIEHGADVNAQVTGVLSYSMRVSRSVSEHEGISALHYAVRSQRTDLVRYLLGHGARTNLKDWSGRTPLDIANGIPARPLPLDAGGAKVPDPFAPANAEVADNNVAGFGSAVSPKSEAMAEIRTLLEKAAGKQ